jgi:hypothetical protein
MRGNIYSCRSRVQVEFRLGFMPLLLLLLQLVLLVPWRHVTAFTSTSQHYEARIRSGIIQTPLNVPTTARRPAPSSTQLYWGFFRRDDPSSKTEVAKKIEESTTNDAAPSTIETTTIDPNRKIAIVDTPVLRTPEEEATRLRSEAAKSRLEAERMEAELTLRKIDKLEKVLKKQQMDMAMNTTSTTADSSVTKKSTEEIQREIDVLMRKVRGETEVAVISSGSMSTTTASSASPAIISTMPTLDPIWPKFIDPFDEAEYQNLLDSINGMPQFLLGTMAVQVEMEIEVDADTKKTQPINTKRLTDRLDQLRRQDFAYSKKKPPTFTQQQLQVLQNEIEAFVLSEKDIAMKKSGTNGNSWWGSIGTDNNLFFSKSVDMMLQTLKSDARYRSLWDANDTKAIAQLVLEYQYYMTVNTDTEREAQQILQLVTDEEWLKPFIGANNITGTNAVIESLYPKCTTKKDIVYGDNKNDNVPSPIPTEAQVKKLISDVLPKVNFQVTSKAEPVLGGFIVRGTTKLSGDAFIDELDKVMDKSSLKDQMSVFYVNDFTILADEVNFDPTSMNNQPSSPAMFPEDGPPVLYVASANVCREPLPLRLSIVSALGLATTWYFSIYPFLLNPGIASRVDEQLAIADANMVPDLTWLSDLSVPLFAAFMSIQLSHELGHLIVAGANGIKTSPPTFVPSFFTGITSTVTTFRTPPKNTATMFDYAVAGPLAGIITSVLAIAVGCQLTSAASDASLFPALPLEILRQSTLGGGIIETVLGYGALSLPKAAIGTAAVAGMTVPLHPVAIAGFISLIINALALLPIGSK